MTTRYFMSDGVNDLDVLVDSHADLDGEFEGICTDTGEVLSIKGWMISELEQLPL